MLYVLESDAVDMKYNCHEYLREGAVAFQRVQEVLMILGRGMSPRRVMVAIRINIWPGILGGWTVWTNTICSPHLRDPKSLLRPAPVRADVGRAI